MNRTLIDVRILIHHTLVQRINVHGTHNVYALIPTLISFVQWLLYVFSFMHWNGVFTT